MRPDHKAIAITALLSAGLFLLIYGLGFNFLFLLLFLPTLPLFSAGLGRNPSLALAGGAVAALVIGAVAGPAEAAMYLLIYMLPSWLFCYYASQWHDLKIENAGSIATLRIWFPVGGIVIHLATYACALLAIITAIYATQDVNLPQTLIAELKSQIAELEKLYDVPLDVSAEQLSYMVCAFMAWIWAGALWMHAWLANRALAKRHVAKRGHLSVAPFPMPGWLLSLIGICALASLIGGESMAFLGKACLIILMLPYCFQGAAYMHVASYKWPNRKIILGIMYFIIVTQVWSAFGLVAIGFWQHLKFLNKHLRAGGTSSKS